MAKSKTKIKSRDKLTKSARARKKEAPKRAAVVKSQSSHSAPAKSNNSNKVAAHKTMKKAVSKANELLSVKRRSPNGEVHKKALPLTAAAAKKPVKHDKQKPGTKPAAKSPPQPAGKVKAILRKPDTKESAHKDHGRDAPVRKVIPAAKAPAKETVHAKEAAPKGGKPAALAVAAKPEAPAAKAPKDKRAAAAAKSEPAEAGKGSGEGLHKAIALLVKQAESSKSEVTYTDIEAALVKTKIKLKPDVVDDIITALTDAGIDVADGTATRGKTAGSEDEDGDDILLPEVEDGAAEDAEDGDAETEKPETVDTSDTSLGKSNDPVRIYLRKMGSVALLSREGEVEIAKKIESEENLILERLLGLQLGLDTIVNAARAFVEDEIRMKGFIKGFDDDEASKDEQLHADKMKKATKKALKLVDDYDTARKKKSAAKKHQEVIDDAKLKVFESFK